MNINHSTGELRLDKEGREIPDPTPVELPVGFKRQETVAQMVARLVRKDVSEYAARHDMETFADADDFDLDDEDFDPHTPYETQFDPTLNMEINADDFKEPDKREWLKGLYMEHEKNRIRAEEAQDRLDAAYRLSKLTPKQRQQREAAEGAAPSSDPPGEPLKAPK